VSTNPTRKANKTMSNQTETYKAAYLAALTGLCANPKFAEPESNFANAYKVRCIVDLANYIAVQSEMKYLDPKAKQRQKVAA
jgi:hypothetical protein